MRLSEIREAQHRGLSLHIPAEVEEVFRQAYLKLHRMKFELDQMEEIPSFLHPMYSEIMHLADEAGRLVQETEKLKSMARKISAMH